MSKVLVTGANGFVGRHIVAELLANGSSVVGVGGPQPDNAPLPESVEYSIVDLTDRAQVATLNFQDISGVIHLAGMAAVGPSFDNPMAYITTNIGIETNLIEEALAQDVHPRFIIISSGSLYDPGAELPLAELSRVVPSSPYAVSKIGQEQMAHYYRGRGLECIIARPFNHIGPGQGLGFIVPDLTKQLVEIELGKRTELLVGNLDAERDYTDVRDIARGYRLLLEKGISGETYNICSGKPRSGHAILDGLTKSMKISPTIVQDPAKMRPSDSPTLYGSSEKLLKDTGWKPEISIETTLSDVVADWRNRSL
jgi:GDP-4-dehydro-6-deoxy-D-mannose reductase